MPDASPPGSRPPAGRLLARAVTLRCPRCGARGLFLSWFRMKEHCDRCGFALQRGEAEDYWLGGMMFNIVLSEMLAVIVVAAAVLASWPAVPWNVVWVGAVLLMIGAPFLLYPLSRTTWLAFDLLFRPKHESHYR
ncbi:MAG TPA: DUF983 domain-containing protein [Gemmatimonadaceae bacterium]|nr:DUF983 domain-containing protein [Gemmatimonadaceae bacterium]